MNSLWQPSDRRVLIALLGAALVVLTHCGGDVPSGECTADDECRAGVCIDQTCVRDEQDATRSGEPIGGGEPDAAERDTVEASDVADDAVEASDAAAVDDAGDENLDAADVQEDHDASLDGDDWNDASQAVDAADAGDEADVPVDTGRETGGQGTPDAADAVDTVDAPDVADVPDIADVVDAADVGDFNGDDLGTGCSEDTECTSGNCSNGHCAPPGFSHIPPGDFIMGSPDSEEGRLWNEPQHPVTLTRGFFLQQTEVTQAQWSERFDTTPWDGATWCGDDCPVDFINWYEALAYANALSDAHGLPRCYVLGECSRSPGDDFRCSVVTVTTDDGNPLACEGYRLPTEAEWEYAARAGTTTATYRGNLQPSHTACSPQPTIDPIAWYCGNSGGYARPVATRAPNRWGLYDTLGNAAEWCWDVYEDYPEAATDPIGAESGAARVQRGGDAASGAVGVRAAHRGAGGGYPFLRAGGVRLARTAPTP